jgi:hypothetical protein
MLAWSLLVLTAGGVIAYPGGVSEGTARQSAAGGSLASTGAGDEPGPPERRHPGHQMKTEYIAATPEFKIGEPVPVVLRITNIGDAAFTFMRGGRQRGARDNQFAFNAQLGRRMLPDVGDPVHFGGLGSYVLLRPGEHVEIPVDLTKWFSFGEAGLCSIRGSYFMAFADPELDAHPTIWEDFACAEFTITITDR